MFCHLHGYLRPPPCYDCQSKELLETAKFARQTLEDLPADHPDRVLFNRFAEYCERKAKALSHGHG